MEFTAHKIKIQLNPLFSFPTSKIDLISAHMEHVNVKLFGECLNHVCVDLLQDIVHLLIGWIKLTCNTVSRSPCFFSDRYY